MKDLILTKIERLQVELKKTKEDVSWSFENVSSWSKKTIQLKAKIEVLNELLLL
jgi:hypothetical protein